jgi:hypothetical protein
MSTSTCNKCHKSWQGLTKAHCAVCHETFSTNGSADKHWRDTPIPSTHLDVEPLIRSGKLVRSPDGTIKHPGQPPQIATRLEGERFTGQ